MSDQPASVRAAVRRILRVHGVDRGCPSCGCAAGYPCQGETPEAMSCCAGRRVPDLAEMALTNGILLCSTDADYDAYLPEMEAIRVAHFSDAAAPVPVWVGAS